MDRPIAPELRQRYDEIFMAVISSAQAEVQGTVPQAAGSIAAMFHREQVSSALQNLAALIAGWNAGKLDLGAARKCAGTLRALGLESAAERLERLEQIDAVTGEG